MPGMRIRIRGPSSMMPANVTPTVSMNAVPTIRENSASVFEAQGMDAFGELRSNRHEGLLLHQIKRRTKSSAGRPAAASHAADPSSAARPA